MSFDKNLAAAKMVNSNINTFKAKLEEKKWLTDEVMKLSFKVPEDFSFKAGQFVNIHIVKDNGEKKYKAYSILSPPSQKGKIDLCVKIIPGGFASEKFLEAKIGEEFMVKGPFGHFTLTGKELEQEVCFIATGVGVAPIYSILKEQSKDFKNNACLLFGVKTRKDLLFHEEFLEMEKNHPFFEYKPVLSRDTWDERTGRVHEHLGKCYKCGLEEVFEKKVFYICGQKAMVADTEKVLLSKGVKKNMIRIERFS